MKVHYERALERDGSTVTYRLVEDEDSVGWVRGETVDGELIGEPQALPLVKVTEELGGEAGEWASFVTRKLWHDLGGRHADAVDAAMYDDGEEEGRFESSMAEADRNAAKIAKLFGELHGSSP